MRRQPRAAGEQLAFDDLDGWRLHAIITNIDPVRMGAAEVEAHHRLRGGVPKDTIRALKNDFGMNHAPVQSFFGNWLYWQALALAHNSPCGCAPWRCWPTTTASGANDCGPGSSTCPPGWSATAAWLHLRFGAAYRHLQAFITALNRLRALPAFG